MSNKKSHLKSFFIACLLGLLLVLVLRLTLKKPAHKKISQNAKVKAVASFYPLAEFILRVGGDDVEVISLTPPGVEPHDFEPSPQDLIKIRQARLFVYNGAGLDPWANKIINDLKKNNVAIINMSDNITLGPDPHYWLDPVLIQKKIVAVRDALTSIDPNHRNEYQINSQEFISQLSQLDQKYKDGLSQCQLKEIVVSHNAFHYLTNRYHLTSLYILGLFPNEEPRPKRIVEVAKLARQKNIKYIFFETLVDPKIAETIASEIGAATLVLNPIEGLTKKELQEGKNYLTVMEDNLTNLRKALNCK